MQWHGRCSMQWLMKTLVLLALLIAVRANAEQFPDKMRFACVLEIQTATTVDRIQYNQGAFGEFDQYKGAAMRRFTSPHFKGELEVDSDFFLDTTYHPQRITMRSRFIYERPSNTFIGRMLNYFETEEDLKPSIQFVADSEHSESVFYEPGYGDIKNATLSCSFVPIKSF